MAEKAKKIPLLMKVLIVMWAFAFAQGSQFADQYQHHLAGHVEELKHQLSQMEKALDISFFDMEERLAAFKNSSNEELAKVGKFLLNLYQRFISLQRAETALHDASTIQRPFTFIRHIDFDIAKETSRDFTWGLPLTIDALVFAILGAAAGCLVYYLIIWFWKAFKALFDKKSIE